MDLPEKDFVVAERVLSHLNSLFQKNFKGNAIPYLVKRGVTSEEIRYYELGYSTGTPIKLSDPLLVSWLKDSGIFNEYEGTLQDGFFNRITIPIYDEYGRLIGFQGRTISSKTFPPYKTAYIRRFSGFIYGLNYILPKHYRKTVFVTEGWFDYLALRRIIEPVVTTFTVKVSKRQLKLLRRYFSHAVLCFDVDKYAVEAAERISKILRQVGMEVSVIEIPSKLGVKDWDEVNKNHGLENTSKLFNSLCNAQRIRLS